MRVSRWGKSLAVRIPAADVEALGLKEGDEINLYVADLDEMGVSRRPTRKELVEQLRQYRGLLPDDFKFNREEANAR